MLYILCDFCKSTFMHFLYNFIKKNPPLKKYWIRPGCKTLHPRQIWEHPGYGASSMCKLAIFSPLLPRKILSQGGGEINDWCNSQIGYKHFPKDMFT